MKEKTKYQKGFLQIPAIIWVVIIIGVVIGFGQYKGREDKNISTNQQETIGKLQESVGDYEQEIEKLKSENQEDAKKIQELEQKQKEAELKAMAENYQPLTSTNEFFAGHIVKVICSNDNSGTVKNGSGTVFGLNRFVITNYHLVEDATQCIIGVTNDIKKPPSRWYNAAIASNIASLDIATLEPIPPLSDDVLRVTSVCPSGDIELGDEVIIIGYPTVGGNTITVTEGIVSGFDGFIVKTSAKMEFGSSGGGAFLRKAKTPVRGILSCWFGIPTFVAQGELESLGRIINYSLIHEQANQ